MRMSHKILLYPTPAQAAWLLEQAGYERWAWNSMLGRFKRGLDNGIWWDANTLHNELRARRPEWTA